MLFRSNIQQEEVKIDYINPIEDNIRNKEDNNLNQNIIEEDNKSIKKKDEQPKIASSENINRKNDSNIKINLEDKKINNPNKDKNNIQPKDTNEKIDKKKNNNKIMTPELPKPTFDEFSIDKDFDNEDLRIIGPQKECVKILVPSLESIGNEILNEDKKSDIEESKVISNDKISNMFDIMYDNYSKGLSYFDNVYINEGDDETTNFIEIKEKKEGEIIEGKKSAIVNEILERVYGDLISSIESSLFPKRANVKPKVILRGIKVALWNIESYIEEIFNISLRDPEAFISSLSVPLIRDPLFILSQIQSKESEIDTVEQTITQPVLPIDLYLALEQSRKIDSIDENPTDPKHKALLSEWSNIHDKCIFDAVNDSLDYYRPYELKGPPLPWSPQVRTLIYRNGSASISQEILLGVKVKILTWAMTNAGMLELPEDLGFMEALAGIPNGKKAILEQLREERLELLIASEVDS